jgi:acetyl-CoA acetyltransferase
MASAVLIAPEASFNRQREAKLTLREVWCCRIPLDRVTINRFCSSGLQAIAMGADYIRDQRRRLRRGGGVESISIPGGGMGGAGYG